MKPKDKLHILNGQVMFDHFQKTGFLKEEMMIPFNEAMCYGDVTSNIFSKEFIAIRAKVHHVTVDQYEEITLKPLQPIFNQTFEHIVLWFDDDMFCQINILTILAWLEQINHTHTIKLHIVDKNFSPVEIFSIKVQHYHKLYTQVLLEKKMPRHIQLSLLKKGIELYLSYFDHNSDLMTFIQKHNNLSEKELLMILLEKFSHYGLGDRQYLSLIRNNRESLQ